MAKEVALELKKRNKNYGSMSVADAAKQNTRSLRTKLLNISDDQLNPTLANCYGTQRLGMALGWNNPPQVLSQADFDKVAKQSPYPVIYRGVTRSGNYDERTLVDDMKYGDTTWRGGSACCWGVGIYTSTSRSYADQYAEKIVTKACIDPKAKVIDWDDLVDEAKKRGIARIDYNGPSGDVASDMATMLAMQLGYQVIRVTDGNSHSKGSNSNAKSWMGDFYNVLDRGAMIVQKEDG